MAVNDLCRLTWYLLENFITNVSETLPNVLKNEDIVIAICIGIINENSFLRVVAQD